MHNSKYFFVKYELIKKLIASVQMLYDLLSTNGYEYNAYTVYITINIINDVLITNFFC